VGHFLDGPLLITAITAVAGLGGVMGETGKKVGKEQKR
jgi:hypothetical protein